MFIGNIMNVFRASMGDFAIINASSYLSDEENYIFWLMFMMTLVFTNIIFLNFVIAEASNSYSVVQEQLEQFILKEKSLLIEEAESMIPSCLRKKKWYPKYIVVREMEL